jgi:hypothetical protein
VSWPNGGVGAVGTPTVIVRSKATSWGGSDSPHTPRSASDSAGLCCFADF